MNPSDDHHHMPLPGADALALLHSVTQHLGSAVALVDERGQWIFLSDAMSILLQGRDTLPMQDLTEQAIVCIRQQREEVSTLSLTLDETEKAGEINYHPIDVSPHGLCLLTVRLRGESDKVDTTDVAARALVSSLKQEALTDPLTGLFNRRYLTRQAPGLLQQAVATRKPLSLILLDLDHFKQVNDVHGHLTGDQVLKIAASRMRAAVRPQDQVCRYGGEEFLVLLPDTGIELATAIAQRILSQISQNMDCLQSQRLTASLGVSQLRTHENSLDAALQRADQALYAAKSAGRNGIKTSP